MRILFAVHRFPPNHSGGADLYTFELAQALVARGHSVAVFCAPEIDDKSLPDSSASVRQYSIEGVSVYEAHCHRSALPHPFYESLVENAALRPILEAVVSRFAPDILHQTAFDHVTVMPLSVAQMHHVPTVVTLTGSWLLCARATLLTADGSLCPGERPPSECLRCISRESRFRRLYEVLPAQVREGVVRALATNLGFSRRGGVSLADALASRSRVFEQTMSGVSRVFAPSHCFQDLHSRSKVFRSVMVEYSPHGHNLSGFSGTHSHCSDQVHFAYTGQLLPHKGVMELLQAFAAIRPSRPTSLDVYGTGRFYPSYYQEIERFASHHANIHLRGEYGRDDLPGILGETDAVVVPSLCVENAPLVIAEARAAHTPVVGSDTCGVAEWIRDGIDGLVFRRGDVADLAEKMQLLVDHPEVVSELAAN